MNGEGEILELLRRDGVIQSPDVSIAALNGGVSSEIYLVTGRTESFVVKRALAKLKVQADWFADVNRNQHEWEYIAYISRFLPEAVPVLQHCSKSGGYFTMEYLGPVFSSWKKLLMAGVTDLAHATIAGQLLAQIHRHSSGDAEARHRFDTTENFYQLRIEPYLLATAEKHPAMSSLFRAEAERLAAARECLVHGDFSPKNILISENRMVILDCEVAWYGDPVFDLAFLLNHFLLKALWHAPNETGLQAMAENFWRSYQALRPGLKLDVPVGRLLLMLLLARVDGKSPVEYLDPVRQNVVREFVHWKLPGCDVSLNVVLKSWFNRLRQIEK